MSVSEAEIDPLERVSARPKRRPRSAITSGRQLFSGGNPNSAWSRRYADLCSHHIQDISRGIGRDVLSEAQLSLIRRAASIETELEKLDALLSLGEAVNLNEYGRATSHLRRLFEVLGVERTARDVSPDITPDDYIARLPAEAPMSDAEVVEESSS